MKTFTISATKNILKGAAAILLYIGGWQLLSMMLGKSLVLPGPWETLTRIVGLLALKESWITIANTLLRITIGFAIGSVAGILLGMASANSKLASWLLAPLRTIIKSTPVTSFILILLVLSKTNTVPVIISAIMVTPIIWASVETGIQQLDVGLKEVKKIYFTPLKGLFHVTIPQLMPSVLSSAATAWGFAWKSAIAAEILAYPVHSMGRELYLSKIYLETVDLFAWTIVAVILSIITEQLLRAVFSRRRA